MSHKNENLELLNYIYQNATTGVETIDYILEQDVDKDIIDELKNEQKEYADIQDESEKMIYALGGEEKNKSVINKLEMYFSIKMSTMKNDKSSHIAEMMIQGNNMGIVDITKNLNRYKNIDDDVRKLSKRLLKMQESNVQELKKYL